MNNTKEILDTVVETQTKAINSFVETANKFQEAMKSENAFEKSSEVYKNWWESQLSIFKNIATDSKIDTPFKDAFSTEKTEDFYKNIYTSQLDAIKKATDFNLNMYNSLSSFGKPATETSANFLNMNSTWNTLFESWTNTLNSTFESLNKTMPKNMFNSDLFTNAMNTNNLYFKLQEFYQPLFTAFKSNNFSADNLKNMFDPAQYKKITEELFKQFFPTNNLNSLLENNTKFVQDFFATQKNTNKDFQAYWSTFSEKFPTLISGDFAKFNDTFKNAQHSFTESFAPLMKLVTDSKEKENVELAIASIDKASVYSMKLAEMQYLLYTTGQNVSKEAASLLNEKAKDTTFTSTFQPFFNEWVAINEKHYTQLFATDEFSKLKAELTTLSLEIKKNLEFQFENKIEALPLVVKSEMNELYQTIHDLKKTVKTLESKLTSIEKPATAKTTTRKAATV
jgi:polyhydroxyalkanoate synthesis regulator phasin